MQNITNLGYAKINPEEKTEAMIFIHAFVVSHQSLGIKPTLADLIDEMKEDGITATEEELKTAEKMISEVKEDKEVQNAIREMFNL